MSNQIAALKQQEIEYINKAEALDREVVEHETCPNCEFPVAKFAYIQDLPLRIYGWLECTNCGVVFCPPYLRELKKDKPKEKGNLILIK